MTPEQKALIERAQEELRWCDIIPGRRAQISAADPRALIALAQSGLTEQAARDGAARHVTPVTEAARADEAPPTNRRNIGSGSLAIITEFLDGPCPICGGVEGCSDTVTERLRFALTQPGGEVTEGEVEAAELMAIHHGMRAALTAFLAGRGK